MKYDGTYGDRAERALAAIADGNSAKLVLAVEGFKTDAEWAEALITQHRVDVNFAKAQRDVAEEKISALPEALRSEIIDECAATLRRNIAWMKAHTNQDGLVTGEDFFCTELAYLEPVLEEILALKTIPSPSK